MAAPPPSALSAAKKSLFGTKKAGPPPMPGAPSEDLAILARRLRLLEERYSRVEKNLRSIEDNMNNISRDFNRIVVRIKSDVESSTAQIEQMQDRMLAFIKELDLLAQREDVEVIKKFLKYWQPIKFVQTTQVERIVKDVLSELGIYERV